MRCSWEWMIGVRKKAQSVLLSTMRARCTPKYTLLSPAPTQLKKSGENCSFSFLENDAGHWERLPAENGEFVFFPFWNTTTPIPTGILLSLFFFDQNQKRPGKKLGYRPPETIPLIKAIGLLRTQTLRRENDGPIGIPIDDDLRQETLLVELFFWKTPFLQCKVTQRLISVLKQHPDEIGLSKCVLEATTIDKQLYAAVSLLPHDAAASPSCAKKIWVDSFKHDPSERSLFWHAFFP